MADLTEDQKIIAAQKTQIDTLTKERDTARTDLTTAEGVIDELKEKLAEKEAGTVKLPTVNVGKRTYEFLSDFMYKGQEVTIELLKDDTTLAEELVKEGVGNLRELKKKA